MRLRVVLVAAVVAACVPALAGARDETPADKGNGLSACEERYLKVHEEVAETFGPRAPGRNFVADGIEKPSGEAGPVNNERACAEVEDLEAMLAPPPAPAPTEVSSSGNYVGAASSTMESIAACESGGDPTAVNPAGYYGKYQFDMDTWVSVGGSGNPAEASEAEQDMRAQMLYDQAGSTPWPVCGQ